jgi:two-component system, chemotaxis family, protein-glutamate methylesterase/glutaminase
MSGHDLIVVGTSSGGLEALLRLVSGLPKDLPASVCIVQHVSADSPDLLATLLGRVGPLPVTLCQDGMPIEHGQIAVAPPDRHLLVEQGRLRLSQGSQENRHRPSIDVLFRSAAVTYGPRVIGVILTGRLDDGTAGLLAIKQCGGIAVVQDPQDALYPSMPENALQHVAVDFNVPLSELVVLLVKLASQSVAEGVPVRIPPLLTQEVQIAAMDELSLHAHDILFGTPSFYSCPDCGGILQERQEGSLLRFRCQVGHAFSVNTLLEEQPVALERALWVALKTLRERGHLAQRLSNQAQQAGSTERAKHYKTLIQETQQHISFLERVLQQENEIRVLTLNKSHEKAFLFNG